LWGSIFCDVAAMKLVAVNWDSEKH